MSKYLFFENRLIDVGDPHDLLQRSPDELVELLLGARNLLFDLVQSPMLNYAIGIFGGMRGYWNEDHRQLYLFRPHDHFNRFHEGAGLMKLQLPYTTPQLIEITKHLLRAEGFREDCYIRPLGGKLGRTIGVKLVFPPDTPVRDAVMMFAIPFGEYHQSDDLSVMFNQKWRKLSANMIPQMKITASYANSALAHYEATTLHYHDGIMLNDKGYVTEAVAANLFMVKDGKLMTPALDVPVLRGITRSTMFRIADNEFGIGVIERDDITPDELKAADEVFFCGTGYKIAAVSRVNGAAIGSGAAIGPMTQKIRDIYLDIVYARKRYSWQPDDWLVPVYG